MKRIAIFASGNGSNAEVIMKWSVRGELGAEVALIVTDNPSAFVVERAKGFHVPVYAFDPKQFESKAQFEQEIVTRLKEKQIEWVFLAGYMRLIGDTLLQAYGGKIVNIHPSLLPSFPGLDAIGQALAAKVKITGVTIHFVDAGMDTGPIIAQEAILIDEDDTYERLTDKIRAVEHQLYPQTIRRLLNHKESVH